ncbi:uncharacterized protein PV07_10942 [Cladophialophora immunda]|uniref:A-kinase anchor protein 7-like phosphoesterase domain-containing protein n=1 Tax=Cladophialophora immunda TaxID=569365 RepID=A0A0D2ACT7_9EURO|nr:uncharacterized protein PV07_10942 [Cladophialophora immunda]KIW22667.1 hypothetical protein PV07_10942 [Cladophialophora immunda]
MRTDCLIRRLYHRAIAEPTRLRSPTSTRPSSFAITMASIATQPTTPSKQTHSGHQPVQAASGRMPSNDKPAKSQSNKRPTHFVCFPLVSDESVSQLSQSLAYFRSVTTPLPSADRDATPERDVEQSRSQKRGQDADQAVRIIPDPAHRPPGTFHLTLGVMHLATAKDLENAAALLQKIDYLELLRRAESGEGDDAQKAVRGRRNKGGPRGAASGDVDEQTPDKETRSKGQEEVGGLPAGEVQPSQSNVAQHDARSLPPVDEDQAGSQDLRQPTSPQPMPDPPNHHAEEKGKPRETAKDVGAMLSSPLQTLQSLTREVSPPRVPAPSTLPEDDSGDPELPQPLTISLSALGTFPSARSARVFFAHPHDPSSRLHRFGNLVRDVFREAGLITETRPLVLHATVANMIYVKSSGGKGRGRGGKWKGKAKGGDDGNVDAREILRRFNHGPDAGTSQAGASSSSPSNAHTDTHESTRNGRKENEPPPAAAATPKPTSTAENNPHGSDVLETETEQNPQAPFIWARDITIRSVRICKMGAEPSATPGWGLEYRPVAEKMFMP